MRLKRVYFFLVVGILPLLFILRNPYLNENLHQLSLTLLRPFLIATSSTVSFVQHTQTALGQFWNAFHEQSQSKAQIAALESKVVQFEEMKKENDRLKTALQFKQASPKKTVAARVIGGDLSPLKKTLILDKGKSQGISKDMTVMTPEGLVGRVIEVGPMTSRVLLLLDPDSRVTSVTTDTRSQGVVEGNGSGKLTMQYLDLDSGVVIGENVLTSGIGGLFPKALQIGRIENIAKGPDGLHLMAQVKPFVNFSKLEEVLCIEFSRNV